MMKIVAEPVLEPDWLFRWPLKIHLVKGNVRPQLFTMRCDYGGTRFRAESQTSLVSVQAGAPVYLRHYLEEKEEKGSELFILETGPEK